MVPLGNALTSITCAGRVTHEGSELRIWVDAGSARPFICALRPLAELSADTDTTPADQDQVVGWASRYMEAETGRERATVLSMLRSSYFLQPVTELPRRVGVA